MTVCNVALDSVVSDMFGVSASKITDYLIKSDHFDPEHVISLLHSRMKPKADAIIESIQGYQLSKAQKYRMSVINSHLDFVEKSIEKLDARLDTFEPLRATSLYSVQFPELADNPLSQSFQKLVWICLFSLTPKNSVAGRD